ncbi:hypothetical protein N7491_006873 [Penicillium cf. griseofulvum]|uniref:Carrier domain-containing protein n=1 Tax=Penicillium cf. griseofulvum TaxID=2972120 RepID=A0A9W9M2Q4_9EURO|nr:hypothetical protein N7472_010097 [Penicillium cf. griseofulvum]KAJ5429857.1 hypothetical protein N7491_006873 [Penicillium cf. griseofulvum]
MQTTKVSDTLRNSLQSSNCLSHAVPSQYPWLEDGSHTPATNPAEWLTENSNITLSDALLSEEDMRPLACTAWAITMSQYTGRNDASFGIFSHGNDDRSSVEAFAVDCESTLTVSDLIIRAKSQSKKASLNANTHCRDVGAFRNYLAFTLRPASEIINADHLPLSPPDGSTLILWVTLNEKCVDLRSNFDPNAATRVEIRRAMGHFSQAFHHVISSELQTVTIGNLSLFTSEDNAQLQEWNAQAAEPVNNFLHTLFQETSTLNQEKLAVLYCGKGTTYKELDVASSNLALQILHADNSLGGNVPICMEKSSEMIVAMIAVLKANKTFVPIDLTSSKKRHDSILASLQPKIVLLSEDADKLRLFDSGVKKLIVGPSTLNTKPACQTTRLPAGIDPAQPAYILFTSGSTGIPKGVVVEHRNVCTSMKELGRQFGLNSETRMFQYADFTFDVSTLEIFATIIHGGCVCMPTEAERLNNIPKAIREMEANAMLAVPSVLKLLCPEEIPTVKTLVVGGEKLTKSLIDIWVEKTHLINAYGPTETCVCSLANLRVSTGRFGGHIGTSIACRAWVVSPSNERQLTPIGGIGELWIEGPTVARGYLHDLAATEASFVSSLPWADGGGITRAYRTGDLVRYLPDGEVLFLDRKDNQVKINGRRIEVEEIEACICQSPNVARASVQLRNIGDSAILAAFLVPQGAIIAGDDVCNPLDPSEHNFHALLNDLREQLPAYMVPEYLIPVNSIPRMTSGKVGQHTLAAILEQVRIDRHHSRDSDRTEENQELLENHKTMRDLWAKVLDIPPSSISASDRFLHLGGNSIKAMKLVSKARSNGISLTVKELLMNCTVDELNHSHEGEPVTEKAVRLRSELQYLSPQSYTPTWIQMVSLTTVAGFPEGNYLHIVIDLRGRLDLVRLREACQSLVQKNEVLRTQFSLQNGTIEANVIDELEVPFLHFTSRSEALENWESFPSNSFNRQLATFSYVVIDENSTHFALGIQHSQYDAWSIKLLLHQLRSIYHGHEVCTSPPFSAFAKRVPQATNPEAERFWKEQLSTLPMTLLSDSSTEGDEPDRKFQKSLRLSPSGFTFATGESYLAEPVSGRNIEMEGILDVVGPCINMLPFPIDVTQCETYFDILQSVQNTMIATVPYESMPMPDIITRCTDWSLAAVFGSIVQHLDITFDLPAVSQAQYEGDSSMLEWNYLEMKKCYGRCRATDIYIFSTTSREGFVDVQFKFNPSRITPELAEVLFGDLCGNLEAALRSPEQKILRDL